MKLKHLREPELEFDNGKHIDIRYGLMNYGPHDLEQPRRPQSIKVGVVGSSASISQSSEWLDKCSEPIAAKESDKPNLFPHFPGFCQEHTFKSELVLDSSLTQQLTPRDLSPKAKDWKYEEKIRHMADVFSHNIAALAEKSPDVILLAMPEELIAFLAEAEDSRIASKTRLKLEFHDLVKGLSMSSGCPIQLVRPSTWDSKIARRLKDERSKSVATQDEATREWNLFTALYYKAGGFPYRVPRPETSYDTCYIGIAFFVTPDKKSVQSSVANVFNERGHGVAVKGKEAKISRVDRQPHLSAEDSTLLFKDCLQAYRTEHKRLPARVVIHKSSQFSQSEKEGFLEGAEALNIDLCDMMSVSRSSSRLFREGYYPPLRGTWWQKTHDEHNLYTRGSVDFYQEYPGMYVPMTLGVKLAEFGTEPRQLMEELLVLSKTNWNNTQIDSLMPITDLLW